MERVVLALRDVVRDRALTTDVHLARSGARGPLIVFGHGGRGNQRKFTRLFSRWVDAGYVVAAPLFPNTNDCSERHVLEDVVNQPADISFVIDELVSRGVGDADRIGVGGFSLGAETALAVALHPEYGDRRVRAVVAIAGGLFDPHFAAESLLAVPLLMVHGEHDTKHQRLDEALRIYGAAHSPKTFVIVEGARHGICQDEDPPERVEQTADATTAFWNRYLP